MSDLLKNLNPEQKEAVTYGEGPVLIVAGAGTGKTMVITHRIAYLIEKGLASPEEIIALAFTEKSAGEMEERIDRLLPYGYTNLWISTFHSFCEKLLKDYGLEIGLPDFKILSNTEQWIFFRKNFDKFNLDYYRPLGNPNKSIRALLDHFSRLKDECVNPAEYLKYVEGLRLNKDSAPECHPEPTHQSKARYGVLLREGSRGRSKSTTHEIARVAPLPRDSSVAPLPQNDNLEVEKLDEVANAYHTYQNLLLEKGYLDFGDLINYTIELFKKRPNVLEECRKKFKYILIDEFQDTNWAQYELIKFLAAPRNNLTVVGDDDQSIYKFRGASLSNILQFKSDFPDAKEVVLIKNYRSGQNILDLSYKFIKQNDPNRLEARLNLDKKLISQCATLKGGLQEDAGVLPSGGNYNGEINHLHFNSLDDEVNGVVEKILELKNKNDDSETTFDDFAILVRANDHATPFCQALGRKGIPYQFMSLKGLYTKPPVLDALAYLKLLDNYHENAAFYRVISWPFWKISVSDLAELGHEAAKQTKSLYEISERSSMLKNISDDGRAELAKIIALISRHAAFARDKTPLEVIIAALKDTGYVEYLNRFSDCDKKDAFDYLNQFLGRVKKFEEINPNSRLKNFLEEFNLEIESGEEGPLRFDPDIGPEMVRVTTVHSAKGLEFKYVFVVNLVDRRFPSSDRREQIEIPRELIKEILPEGDAHLEEERRLFYVAMTRAKQGLYLTSAEDYGGARKKKLSQFLVELGFGKETKPSTSASPPLRPLGPSRTGLGQYSLSDPANGGGVEGSGKKIIYVPEKFSYTQYIAYKTCPLQYKFRHIIRIPTFGNHTRSFGVTIHSTLRDFVCEFNQRKNKFQKNLFDPHPNPPPLLRPRRIRLGRRRGGKEGEEILGFDELIKIYQKNWLDEWYPDKKIKEEYNVKGRELLKLFYDDFIKTKPQIKFLEQPFALKIAGVTLKGNIDRIDEAEGSSSAEAPADAKALAGKSEDKGVVIIDYKTGKGKEASELTKENKMQLVVYQIAAEESLCLVPKKLVFHYLEDGGRVEFLGSEKDKIGAKEEIVLQIEEIKKGDFSPRPGRHCKFCDYKDICQYREL